MTDRIHLLTTIASIGMISAGLWQISVSAMLIGLGVLLLSLVMLNRLNRIRGYGNGSHDKSV